MRQVSFLILLCFAQTDNSYGFLGRVQIPLNEMPSVSNDIFNWRKPDGSYQFGMQGQDQWRVEKRYPNGAVYVHFAYKTPDGKVHNSTFISGVLPKAVIRENVETYKNEHKYEKFETSYPATEDEFTKFTYRNLDSVKKQTNNQMLNENITADDTDNNSKVEGVNTRESNTIIEEKISKPKKATTTIQPKKQSLLDNYIQNQKETEISKSRSFYGISFNIQNPQKSASVKDVLLKHLSTETLTSNVENKYGNRRSRLGTLFKTNDDTDFLKSNRIAEAKKTFITLL